MIIFLYKTPLCENDDFLIRFDDFLLENLEQHIQQDEYTKFKSEQFMNCDKGVEKWKPLGFEKNRLSLRNLGVLKDMSSSIYTVTCSIRNCKEDEITDYKYCYDECIKVITKSLKDNPGSRRVFLRMANSIYEYSRSEYDSSIDATCITGIHYLENGFKLTFRANDIKNELIPDILTIYKYFIVPVYGLRKLRMSIYASTSQNVSSFNDVISKIARW